MDDHDIITSEDMGEGIRVTVRYEEHTEHANPRDADNLGVMFCDYRGYTLGDEDAPDPRDRTITCPQCEGDGEVEGEEDLIECPKCDGAGNIDVGIYEYLKRGHGATVVLPLFVLDHSGLSMSAGTAFGDMESRGRFVGDEAGWDTSLVGVIFDTNESREMIGTAPEDIEEALRGEVETYDSYLRGEVYWWTVEDEDGDILESVGGYLGETDYALSEAKATAASYVEDRKRIARTNELALACWRD
jgi:hypothetical protein